MYIYSTRYSNVVSLSKYWFVPPQDSLIDVLHCVKCYVLFTEETKQTQIQKNNLNPLPFPLAGSNTTSETCYVPVSSGMLTFLYSYFQICNRCIFFKFASRSHRT